jgi:hypothetical protein
LIIGIVGLRDFHDEQFFLMSLFKWLDDNMIEPTQIVTGCAKGVDALARNFAQNYHISLKVFKADWNNPLLGKAAGPARNKELCDYLARNNGRLIAFWDGKSRGTRSCIAIAQSLGLTVDIIEVEKPN